MIEPTKFALFVGASWALIIAPGPDMLVIGYSSGTLGGWLTHKPGYAQLLQRLAGGMLMGLGVRLAVTEQQ